MRTHLLKTCENSLNPFFNPKFTNLRFYRKKINQNKINSEFKKTEGSFDVEKSISQLNLKINKIEIDQKNNMEQMQSMKQGHNIMIRLIEMHLQTLDEEIAEIKKQMNLKNFQSKKIRE